MPRVRLHINQTLEAGAAVALSPEQAHYLFGVMRLGPGARVLLFDGRTGEWEAEVAEAGRRGRLRVGERVRPLLLPPDLWLLFAPLKAARTDLVVEKAAELGCRRIRPVRTERTNSERLRADRLRRIAAEAAEQCGGTFVPEVDELAPLGRVLEGWEPGRALWVCDEALAGEEGAVPEGGARGAPGAVLVGPEGGFTEGERAWLSGLPFARRVGLGPRVLRAETAALAALALWQRACGDWR
ncbi:16S rRNA (uracil(1498)-N(3))-methyltransferase [Rubellimicrobium sp. CFH 75288]|uniref:16S rRNA (uracil(1498)-N(3))-methyltransferase n=1 Tax=Rubellimicrobium sp. CFH 75288 TaxID=2697034 RepID=UPI00141263B1|nr:16S rRNA (uracil(1498)-N(3))-methyltransferase [Rubellimicrobium sp. CFH 75288]NAZ37596.1 16S rRNA (uracil(1498)-N(3))-methyltransferase [Rubellimicrobium sp. CFH 75288]